LSSINDKIKLATASNSVPDGLSSWYSRAGNESLDDAEARWLSNIDTQDSGSNSDMWFNILRSAGYSGSLADMKAAYWESPVMFPSELPDLKLWTRFNSGITVTGSGVSQWDDQSGNGNHLKQGTDTNRPSKESDGSILFDGVDNFLKADAFTLVQPETIYLLVKQVTWTDADYLFDGNASSSGLVYQKSTSPGLRAFAGALSGENTDLVLDAYGVISVTFNGTSGVFQINNNTALTGDYGAANMGGFILGAIAGGGANWSNIQVKEALIYSTAHDAATRVEIIAYLSNVGQL